LPTTHGTMKFAFYGRVSSEDAQDPSLSIPRQFAACERAVRTAGGELTAFYWDIESGRKNLSDRGNGADGDRFAVRLRRDGGLPQLLETAANGRKFDAVIVESIDRLSRMTADATRIERDLEQRDIALFASDEPMTANATSILTRRVKQGVAEWYVRDLIEKSRRGMEESVRRGWHTGGRAPYGYLLDPHEHPNPQKAREGRKKHRLVPDPVKAPIVRMIFDDYCVGGLGLGELCEKLNADLDRYPPPRRNKKDENDLPQTWSRSQLHAMLRNPKYTGYNVWGRQDKRIGRPFIRPRDQWIWSPTPSHEPLVSRELFEQVEERAQRNNNPAKILGPLDYPPRRLRRAGRIYPLRGRVRCGICGRRMEGSNQKGSNCTAAASSPFAVLPPPTPAATRASSAPRRTLSSTQPSTSSAAVSSGLTGSGYSAKNSHVPPTPTTTSAKPSSRGSHTRRSRSIARSTARRSASKNTTTRTIQSSRSPNNESKNSVAAATPSTREPGNLKPPSLPAPPLTKSKRSSTPSPTSVPSCSRRRPTSWRRSSPPSTATLRQRAASATGGSQRRSVPH
jgi:DNA invertase Pin-like site-specific DNA recombinase